QRPVTFSGGVDATLVLAGGRTVNLNTFDLTLDGLGGSEQIDGVITDLATSPSKLIITGAEFAPPLSGGGNIVVINGSYLGPGAVLVTNTSKLVVNGSVRPSVIVAATTTLSGTGNIGGLNASG